MLEEEYIGQPEVQEKSALHSEHINMIKSQWIPDVEALLPDIGDEVSRKGFESELAKIKTDVETLENATEKDEEFTKHTKEVYAQAEELYARVRESIPEADREEISSHSDYLDLAKSQWIPDVEAMLADVTDDAARKTFEADLEQIKAEVKALENAPADDLDSAKRIKEVYDRAEELFARVDEVLPEEEEEM